MNARELALEEALREARDVFVLMSAEPLDMPKYRYVKRARRAIERINAALTGNAFSVEWIDEGVDVAGWYVCDKDGPVEGAYDDKADAEDARADRASQETAP